MTDQLVRYHEDVELFGDALQNQPSMSQSSRPPVIFPAKRNFMDAPQIPSRSIPPTQRTRCVLRAQTAPD
jgi:hypothetical protein